jgi:hypothetical protein
MQWMVKCQFIRQTKIAEAKKVVNKTNQLTEWESGFGFHGNPPKFGKFPYFDLSKIDLPKSTFAPIFTAQIWSISGISVLSREFRPHGQILLCEVQEMMGAETIFALLPESMFRPESALLIWMSKFGPALGAFLTIVICLALLLPSAFFQRFFFTIS